MADVADLERPMRTNCSAHSRQVRIPENLEVAWALSDREDTLGALLDHVVFEEQPAKEERSMRTERKNRD